MSLARGREAFRRLRLPLPSQSASLGRVVDLLERLDHGAVPRLTVLMYHRVAPRGVEASLDPALLSATPEDFEAHVAWLAGTRRVLSLTELLEIRRGHAPLPDRAVVITFDDGYGDFAEHAWPVLRRHEVPATLFVPTAFPSGDSPGFWWDRLHHALHATQRTGSVPAPPGPLSVDGRAAADRAFRTMRDWIRATPHDEAMAGVEAVLAELGVPDQPAPLLNWGELRRLAAEGLAIAPHSRTHPLLHRLPLEQAQAEILGSIRDLSKELGSSPPVFAFPAGGYTDELADWLPAAGIEIGFAVTRGSNDIRQIDWLRVRRINVGRRSTLPVLRAQLLSWLPTVGSGEPLS